MAANPQDEFNNHLNGVFHFNDDLTEALNDNGINDITSLATLLRNDNDYKNIQRAITSPGGQVQVGQRFVSDPGVAFPFNHLRLLKALAYYYRHCRRIQRDFDFANATLAHMVTMMDLMTQEHAREEEKNGSDDLPKLKDTSKVRKTVEDLRDYLARILGASGVPLSYIIRDDVVPDDSINYDDDGTEVWQEMVDRAPHVGTAFQADNIAVYGIIKNVLRDTVGEPWITDYATTRNGRGAFIALTTRYLGDRQSSTIAESAEQELSSRFYNGKSSKFTLSKLIDIHKRCHDEIAQHGDGGALTATKKVKLLCKAIRDPRLRASCDIIRNDPNHRANFDDAAAILQETAGLNPAAGTTTPSRNIGSAGRGGGYGGGRGRGGGRGGRGRGRGGGRGRGRGGRGGRGGSSDGFIEPARWAELQAERRRLNDEFTARVESERRGGQRNASSATTAEGGGATTETTTTAEAETRSASSMSRRAN